MSSKDKDSRDGVEIGSVILAACEEVFKAENLNGFPMISLAKGILTARDSFIEKRLNNNIKEYYKSLQENGVVEDSEFLVKNITLVNNPKFMDLLSQTIVESENCAKVRYFGNLHYALLKNFITFKEFEVLVLIIFRSSVPALEALRSFDVNMNFSEGANSDVGEIGITIAHKKVNSETGLALATGLAMIEKNSYCVLTEYGVIFLQFALKENNPWLQGWNERPRNACIVNYMHNYKETTPKPWWELPYL
ncbi:MAG: hypothetical protein ACJAR1_000441 [Rubritalea sp.]|jgi:hypothetical protein